MTTPSEPGETLPVEPPVVPDEAAAQEAAQEAEAAEAAQLDAIRELATEIAKQTVLDYDAANIRKGVITGIADLATPPTLSIQISGDTTTTIDGVRYYEHYTPVVGDVVHIHKQGTDLVAAGKIAEQYSATGWTQVTLGAGFSHGGNGNGPVKYRRVWDHGSWRMDWKGAAARTSGTAIISTPLATGYRPAVKVSEIAGRNVFTANVVSIEFNTDGTATIHGLTTAPNAAGSHTHSVDITDNAHTHGINNHQHAVNITDNAHTHDVNNHRHAVNITDNAHNHGGGALTAVTINGFTDTESGITAQGTAVTINGFTDTESGISAQGTAVTIDGNTGSGGSHSHTVEEPSWISFNGISYYLDS